MGESPHFPVGAVVVWLAAVADFAGLLALWLADLDVLVKAAVTGVLLAGLLAITSFHAGRRYERSRIR